MEAVFVLTYLGAIAAGVALGCLWDWLCEKGKGKPRKEDGDG